jgi:uncharacterized coiled-coil protein SlyX
MPKSNIIVDHIDDIELLKDLIIEKDNKIKKLEEKLKLVYEFISKIENINN